MVIEIPTGIIEITITKEMVTEETIVRETKIEITLIKLQDLFLKLT